MFFLTNFKSSVYGCYKKELPNSQFDLNIVLNLYINTIKSC